MANPKMITKYTPANITLEDNPIGRTHNRYRWIGNMPRGHAIAICRKLNLHMNKHGKVIDPAQPDRYCGRLTKYSFVIRDHGPYRLENLKALIAEDLFFI